MLRTHPVWRLAMALSGALGCAAAPDSTAQRADLVVYGRVWTGDSSKPWAQGVAIAGETIAAVGDSAALAKLVGPGTRVIANGKAMVVPGFMDAHVHLLSSGFQIARVSLR